MSCDDPLVDRVIELDQQVAASFANKPSAMLLDVFPVSRFLGNGEVRNVKCDGIQHKSRLCKTALINGI